MKKLRLDPEKLSVEAFEVEAAEEAGGTVLGADASSPRNCTGPDVSCGYPYTCGGTSCPSGYPLCHAPCS
ncbi:MAG TPA: hypothetical protein VFJ82_00135 [Longimicrobium sp.]|nr:hypothetical protein [Longimicrobium sp.]